jgi:hypothetical protein
MLGIRIKPASRNNSISRKDEDPEITGDPEKLRIEK